MIAHIPHAQAVVVLWVLGRLLQHAIFPSAGFLGPHETGPQSRDQGPVGVRAVAGGAVLVLDGALGVGAGGGGRGDGEAVLHLVVVAGGGGSLAVKTGALHAGCICGVVCRGSGERGGGREGEGKCEGREGVRERESAKGGRE